MMRLFTLQSVAMKIRVKLYSDSDPFLKAQRQSSNFCLLAEVIFEGNQSCWRHEAILKTKMTASSNRAHGHLRTKPSHSHNRESSLGLSGLAALLAVMLAQSNVLSNDYQNLYTSCSASCMLGSVESKPRMYVEDSLARWPVDFFALTRIFLETAVVYTSFCFEPLGQVLTDVQAFVYPSGACMI